MTSAQVVETSVTNNSSFQNYTHPDDHTIRTIDTSGFKPFIKKTVLWSVVHNILFDCFLGKRKPRQKGLSAYEMGKPIGSGGFGDVYAARRKRDNLPVSKVF